MSLGRRGSTTDPRVVEAMMPYLAEEFGNSVSPHSWGMGSEEGAGAV